MGCVFFLLLNTIIPQTYSIVPNAYNIVIENCYNVILNLVQDNIGDQGRIYFPFVFSVFLFILTTNLTECFLLVLQIQAIFQLLLG